ncbi:zinc finger protein 37-like [Mya arenaria]|uniref:zinc finger protein 37-like n=1 Tax=Mya arenaria TaxID=6604 RepID=UPI0022E3F775|nr:zinc finger protein 37-like [Mya arenaria]
MESNIQDERIYSVKVICGVCKYKADDLSNLQSHIQSHARGDNFLYYHTTKTAFPFFEPSSKETQTYPEECHFQMNLSNQYIPKAEIDNTTEIGCMEIKEEVINDYLADTDVEVIADVVDQTDELNLKYLADIEHSDTKRPQISEKLNKRRNKNRVKKPKTELGKLSKKKDGPKTSVRRNVDRKKKKVKSLDDKDEVSGKSAKSLENDKKPDMTNAGKSKQFSKYEKPINNKNGPEPKQIQYKEDPISFEEYSFCCPHCPEQYTFINSVFCHIETGHSGKYPLVCKKCFCPSFSEDVLAIHVAECDYPRHRTHVCAFCEDIRCFVVKSRLQDHLDSEHSGKAPYACEVCNKAMVSELDKYTHMTEHDRRLLKCSNCPQSGRYFASWVHLDAHYLTKHSLRPWQCPLCLYQFSDRTRTGFLAHLKVHYQCDEYVCEDCGAKYFMLRSVLDHQLVCKAKHGSQAPGIQKTKKTYLCEKCSAAFSYNKNFRAHMSREHGIGKAFPCKVCGKMFYKRQSMVKHERTHAGHRPHVCQTCGKAFSTSWNLKTHMRSHTGEKPYSCMKCGMKYAHNFIRKAHEEKCKGNIYSTYSLPYNASSEHGEGIDMEKRKIEDS